MASTILNLTNEKLINPPRWLPTNTHYEVMMGSVAYGVSNDTSDVDVYGWAIPPREMVFPHLAGEIEGFGRQKKRFEQYQQHHVEFGKNSYDLSIYNVVKYFSLVMENNPNMVDSLFVPQSCVLHTTMLGNLVREHRRLFLHKGAWHKFKGYAYSQLHKMSSNKREGKRAELYEKFGFDVKFAYHTVRLLYEGEMILEEGDIDLQRHSEHLKAIRRGDISEADIRKWASEKETSLERLYERSTLRHSPDEPAIKRLLLNVLEQHYGSLEACIVDDDRALSALRSIDDIVGKFFRK